MNARCTLNSGNLLVWTFPAEQTLNARDLASVISLLMRGRNWSGAYVEAEEGEGIAYVCSMADGTPIFEVEANEIRFLWDTPASKQIAKQVVGCVLIALGYTVI